MSEFIKDGKRLDGRGVKDLRPLEAKIGVIPNADGSAMFKMGDTVAIAGVYGPRTIHPRKQEDVERSVLRIRYNMAAFSTKERSRPGPSRRSQEISMVIRKALESLVFLEEFPKTAIDVNVEVTGADASTRCAALNAAALALSDAGIPMRDLAASCASGKVEGQIILDVAGLEDTEGDLDMPIAYYPSKDLITLLQMDGLATKEEVLEMAKLSVEGCKKIYELQKKTLSEGFDGD